MPAAIHGRFGAQVALLQSPILRDRKETIRQRIEEEKRCYLCPWEKMLPLHGTFICLMVTQGSSFLATLGLIDFIPLG
jgi:hypothetical protein